MSYSNFDLVILFGSETGTAEDVAYYIAKQLRKFSLKLTVLSIDDYDFLSYLPDQKKVFFVVSTTGDGDTPSSMKSILILSDCFFLKRSCAILGFWNFLLKKSLDSSSLSSLSFSVFGLGDSSYEKFNATARKLNARLLQLGAKECCPIGLGDDQAKHGYCDALGKWLDNIENLFVNDATHSKARLVVAPAVALLSYRIQSSNTHQYSSTTEEAFTTIVEEKLRLTSSDWHQNVLHIRLRLPSSPNQPIYKAGDIAEVFYCNPTELVRRALSIAAPLLDPSTWLSISLTTLGPPRKTRIQQINCSLFDLFHRHLDIGAVPSRSFFEELASFATSEEESEKLLELSSGPGTDLYWDYCVRERRNYVEVLEDFKSARPPLEKLLELIPVVRPRQYSIASSPSVQPDCIDLCVAVAQRKTPYKRTVLGLCSGYLAGLSPGDAVRVRLRKGLLSESRLSSSPGSPAILIGPGTGIAPMRAILGEINKFHCEGRELRGDVNGNGDSNEGDGKKGVLFFGCRKRSADYLYGTEWDSINADKSSAVQVHTAFSQDQPTKEYVTHKIRSAGRDVWTLLRRPDCCVWVSGSAKKMPLDVKQALKFVLTEFGGMDEISAERRLLSMMRSKHYVVEAWS